MRETNFIIRWSLVRVQPAPRRKPAGVGLRKIFAAMARQSGGFAARDPRGLNAGVKGLENPTNIQQTRAKVGIKRA
jgi:hypothetical protein